MSDILLHRRRMMGGMLSPYSAEATAILKQDFPAYWEQIKQYGYDNPQYVFYINQDPHLICSLVNVGVIRGLVSSTGPDTVTLELHNKNSVSSTRIMFYARKLPSLSDGTWVPSVGNWDKWALGCEVYNSYAYYVTAYNGRMTRKSLFNYGTLLNVLFDNLNGLYVNNVGLTSAYSEDILFQLYGRNNLNLYTRAFGYGASNSVLHEYVPCKNPNGNDYGMLDIVELEFKPYSGAGAFTVEEIST